MPSTIRDSAFADKEGSLGGRNPPVSIRFEVNHLFLVWASSPEGVPDRLSLQYAVVGILILVYLFTAARSQRRQSVHDWVAGTVVVSTRKL